MTINRRNFLASVAATIALPKAQAAAPAPQATHRPDTGKRPRNVVLFICDDLGYGDLGCYGSHLPTPNLDRLAAEGIRFTHFNSAHPICSASRAALLTGRYGTRSGARGAFMPHSTTGLALDETTLGDLFHQRGFATKAIGKWHLGDAPEYLPTHRGFDSYYGVPYSVDMYPLPLIRDTQILEEDTDRTVLTSRYTEEALTSLNQQHEQHPDKPFFLYFAFSYPHDPARSSPRFRGKSGFGEQGDAIHELDWAVGQVVQSLRTKGLLEDTLVLFTSDHGPWFQGCPGFLRGRKGSTFDGGFRVPLIAHWPAAIQAGQVSSTWMSNLDILPTLSSLCDLPASPKPLDGIDMKHTLLGAPEEPTRKSLLYFTPMTAQGMDFHCARKGDWKARFAQLDGGEIYINDHGPARKSSWLPHTELYNLKKDPAEAYDVAALHPEIIAEILHDAEAQIQTMPEPVQQAFNELRQNPASITTPPGAAARIPSTQPLPPWVWEPPDRR
ncbi:hypothetical protein GCM10011507_17170 [Edaphobacter acidisoli]|uniref:Sulfatase N-terminal domain-containing protein n=1 Tax=Edaphobacter acidisoli TaxID=2040573 RepID=A0A916RR26_9BACT|nr:sulfatase-like hydrolase/transferase [Edaphobacter acidisoli]GGA66154.1 hypothetical protein GCM10011507_17170 [Edaphobacter acidisoli]